MDHVILTISKGFLKKFTDILKQDDINYHKPTTTAEQQYDLGFELIRLKMNA